MHERLAGAAPAIELDGQLDRSVGGLENVEGAESQRIEVTANGGDGGLSDSDRAHGRGFDQRDRDAEAAQSLRERGGRHPARGAATDDEHGTNGSGARVLHGAMVARRRLALVAAAREYVCKPSTHKRRPRRRAGVFRSTKPSTENQVQPCLRLRRARPMPANPRPSKPSVAGSGTLLATSPSRTSQTRDGSPLPPSSVEPKWKWKAHA